MAIRTNPKLIISVLLAAAVASIASVAVVAAFDGSSDTHSEQTGTLATGAEAPSEQQAANAAPNDGNVSQERMNALSAEEVQAIVDSIGVELSAGQKETLADNIVTYEEHEAAIQAFLACGEAAGFTPDPVPGDGERATRPGFTGTGELDSTDQETFHHRYKAIMDECRLRHLEAVDVVWAAQQPEPSAATLKALHEMIRQCVAEGRTGDGPGTMVYGLYENSPEQAIGVTAAEEESYAACALEAEAATGLLAPPPVLIEQLSSEIGNERIGGSP